MKRKRSSRLFRLTTDRVTHPTTLLQTPFQARHRQEVAKKAACIHLPRFGHYISSFDTLDFSFATPT
ncbi:putative Tellurite resistance protein tehA [Corchorus olitorius]|uniref:Tellurite resistance protein tehA n=1 Tax=Corchorus olitorius TaxID=93759 RepID=A0A1R3J6V4_9ROSI|nr:putative Tellurite resistance protein tehA [Corchorus olitorius]